MIGYLLLECCTAYLHTRHLYADENSLSAPGDWYADPHNASSSLCFFCTTVAYSKGILVPLDSTQLSCWAHNRCVLKKKKKKCSVFLIVRIYTKLIICPLVPHYCYYYNTRFTGLTYQPETFNFYR